VTQENLEVPMTGEGTAFFEGGDFQEPFEVLKAEVVPAP
jgi:hypothetical protein